MRNIEPKNKWVSHGLECLVWQHRMLGHYCGYVRVPPDHRLYSVNYERFYDMGIDLDVHGGVTYSQCEGDGNWIGFDMAHSGDYCPGSNISDDYWTRRPKNDRERAEWEKIRMERIEKLTDEQATLMALKYNSHFWTLLETIEETDKLAKQLSEIDRVKNPKEMTKVI